MKGILRSLANSVLPGRAAVPLRRLYSGLILRRRQAESRVNAFRFGLVNRMAHAPVCQPGLGPVVSLTSYGRRIDTVHLVIESIARGRLRPSRLILWLDEEERLADLPVALRRLQWRGLEIRSCSDYGPHKKYYPYVASEAVFTVPLVTADDDVFYPAGWLERLMRAHASFPDAIPCFVARTVALTAAGLAPYSQWVHCDSTAPSFRHIAIGVGGILYPPRFLYVLKQAGEGFAACAPRADDLWLHMQAVRHGFRVLQIEERTPIFPSLPGTGTDGLYWSNLDGGNDEQMRLTYTAAEIGRMRAEEAGRL